MIRLDSRLPASATQWTCAPGEPALVLECESGSNTALLQDDEGIVQMWDDPLAALDWMPQYLAEFDASEARWIGYLGYEVGRLFETIPQYGVDDLLLPLFAFTLHQVPQRRAGWHTGSQKPRERQALTSNFTRDRYLDAVEKAIDYIAAGDVFQVNLSQRFTAALTEHPSRIY